MFKTRPYLTVFAGIVLLFAVAPWIPAGIIPAIIPAAVPTPNKIGNSAKFQLGATGAVSGDCATFDANLNITGPGTGAGCGTGSVTSVFGQTGAVNIPVTTTDISTPSTPSAGMTKWYTKGGKLCSLDPSANENCTGASGGGSGFLFSGTTDPGQPNPLPVQARTCVSCSSLAFSSNVTSGNLIVLGAGYNGGSCGTTLTTISDTLGSTWARANGSSGSGNNGTLYYAPANGSGADTITWTCTGNSFPVTAVGEYSAQAILDASAAVTGSTAPSVTTVTSTDMLVSMLALNHSGTVCTTTAGGTIQSQTNGNDGACIGYQISAAPGIYAGAIHSPDSDTSYILAAFKPVPIVAPGNNGDWYLNTTTGVLWGPKTGGVYSKSSASWVSQTGSNGQFVLTGSPSVGTCGTSPSLATGASNNAGTITVGSGVVTACTLNFSPSFTNVPTCQVADNSTAITSAVTAVSVSAVTFSTSATIGGGKIYYSCF